MNSTANINVSGSDYYVDNTVACGTNSVMKAAGSAENGCYLLNKYDIDTSKTCTASQVVESSGQDGCYDITKSGGQTTYEYRVYQKEYRVYTVATVSSGGQITESGCTCPDGKSMYINDTDRYCVIDSTSE